MIAKDAKVDWLKGYWSNLVSDYADDSLIASLWATIETQYTSKNRYYHNLSHLHHMFLQLEEFKTEIEDLDNLKFAIWFHDIIYKSTKNDNEEQSAVFAETALKSLNYDDLSIKKVKKLIISTKKHELTFTNTNDNAYLLDLDLSILGSEWDTYKTYIKTIRKEYKIYPDLLYKPGRKKVLKYFLEKDTLYFTEQFRTQYEQQARNNLNREIEML